MIYHLSYKIFFTSRSIYFQKFNDNFSDGVVTTSGGLVNNIKNYLPKSVQIFDNLVIDGLESYSQTVG